MNEKIIPIPETGGFCVLFCECGQLLGCFSPGHWSNHKCQNCGNQYDYSEKQIFTITNPNKGK